jgi:hypothetical protein
MNTGADVRSLAALREWMTALANYRSSAVETLSGVEMEIRRAFDWIEDQGNRWKAAVRQCEDEVVQAKSALSSRQFPDASGRMPDTTLQERDLRRAKARLDQAEEQVEKCRQWLMKLPKIVEEMYQGPSRRLGSFLDTELPNSLAHLDRRLSSLESYVGLRPDFAPAPSLASLPTASPPPPPPSGEAS